MASLIARKNVLSTDYYTYQNLPPGAYIRLLDISPGFKGEAISCSLHVTGLDQVPAYTALSYFWGEPVFDHSVLCDGKEVKVTKSLYSALQRLRLPQNNRVVWADAICINQSSTRERGHQVGLMQAVYSEAAETMVFIGECSHPASLLQSFSSKLLETGDSLSPGQFIYDSDSDLAEFGLPPSASAEWEALREFFSAPWFRRAWVVQEYVLSRKVNIIYGDWNISSSYLQKMFYSFTDHSFFGLIFPDREDKSLILTGVHEGGVIWDVPRTLWLLVVSREYRGRDDDALIWLLQRDFNQRASDPRDYVYALLGLASDGFHPSIQPDYSLSVSQVYIKTCHYFIDSGQASFLSEVGPPHDIKGLPSWVPDWSTTRTFSVIGDREVYDAGRGLEQKWWLTESQLILVGRGAIIDAVTHIGTRAMRDRDSVTDVKITSQYFKDTLEMLQEMPAVSNGTDLSKIHFDLLTMENHKHRGASIDMEQFDAWKSIIHRRSADWPGSESDLITKATIFVGLVEDLAAARKACITASNAVGQVPALTQVGDEICIFAGLRAPFVLRPHAERENCYSLIGECYIRGAMRRGFRDSDSVQDIRLA